MMLISGFNRACVGRQKITPAMLAATAIIARKSEHVQMPRDYPLVKFNFSSRR
jgi:hypothetical protein